jgi:uncharacterized protein (DUF58 family)
MLPTPKKRPDLSGRMPEQIGRNLASDGLSVWDMVTLAGTAIAPLVVVAAGATGFAAGASGTWAVVGILLILCSLTFLMRSVRDRVVPLVKEIRGDKTSATAAPTRPDNEPGQPSAGG